MVLFCCQASGSSQLIRTEMKSGIFKLWAFVIVSLILGAAITPWVFEAGRNLAESEARDPSGNGLLAWLSEKAATHPYTDFFKRSLTLCAILLLYPFYLWIRKGAKDQAVDQLKPNGIKGKDWLLGFIVASHLLLSLGFVGISLGFYEYEQELEAWRSVRKALGPAIGAGIIEELLFRGALLGIFLQSCRSRQSAIVGLSILFAVVHQLQPPEGVQVDENAATWSTGFWVLGQIGLRFFDPVFFVAEVVTLFLIGLILADARVKTASLWLPIGLHMGWVFSYGLFKNLSDRTGDGALWIFGNTLKEGVAPLLALLVTWALVRWYFKTRLRA